MAYKKEFRIWMVRAGKGGYLMDEFLKNNIVAIGWNDLGEIHSELSYEQLKDKFREVYHEDPDGRVNQSVGQLWKFVKEFQKGDKVITYDSSSRLYYIGQIESEYKFSNEFQYYHFRDVKWEEKGIDRDILSIDLKNVLGSILTIFELSIEQWNEIQKSKKISLVDKNYDEAEEQLSRYERQELQQLKDDVASRSLEFVKDIITNLSWQDTEKLVAGLLRSLGYKTRLTSVGGDLGYDIIASADVLGLDGPQIKVEVKKRSTEKVGTPEIRNFIGGLRGHHKGIFVTTSGFTKEARYEAERANFPITLIDSDWLVDLIIANYEALDPDIKALIPLRKVYWPV